MAEQEQQPLPSVTETVLKKRKTNEEWILKKRERLEARKQRSREQLKLAIKRPEHFVKEYRDKELDLIRMKQRLRLRKSSHVNLEANLLIVFRIHGSQEMHPKTRKILNLLGLRNTFTGVFLKANEGNLKKLLSVEPYITYGYPSLKSIRDLVYKNGSGMINRQRVPLTDNNIIEQALGSYGIICIEDIVHEIATMGPHFKEVTRFLWPFKLKKPERHAQLKKKSYKDGGDTGNREDKINEFITKFN